MEIGSVAEWVSGTATVLATAAAVFAGILAYRAYLREQARDRQALATGVHAWVASDTAISDREPRLIVANLGSAPIYETRVELTGNQPRSTAPRRGTWQVLPPGQYVVEPHRSYVWDLPTLFDDPHRYRPYTRSEEHLVKSLEFTDARGTRWRRDQSGQLTELHSSDAR